MTTQTYASSNGFDALVKIIIMMLAGEQPKFNMQEENKKLFIQARLLAEKQNITKLREFLKNSALTKEQLSALLPAAIRKSNDLATVACLLEFGADILSPRAGAVGMTFLNTVCLAGANLSHRRIL